MLSVIPDISNQYMHPVDRKLIKMLISEGRC